MVCCANPEGTHGHYMVRDAILPLLHLADPTASTETPELLSNAPGLRPADLYSVSALPGGPAALDVGVCSPDACGAGIDCCETTFERKRRHYRDHADDMERTGLQYLPLVFSCYGRVHADCAAALEHIARQAARRIGVTNHRPLLRRAHAGISVALMKRAASMARACLPKLSKESVQLAFGDTAGGEEDG